MKIQPKHFPAATALILAALLVLGSATQAAAFIVCIGLDGHIDIESFLEGCCISGPAGARSDVAEQSITDSGCGECTDVQVQVPPLRSKENQQVQPDGEVGYAPAAQDGGGVATRTAQATDMDLHCLSLAHLSSVVLLI